MQFIAKKNCSNENGVIVSNMLVIKMAIKYSSIGGFNWKVIL